MAIIHDVEQSSPAWKLLRIGRPTASEFSRIVTNTLDKDTGGYKLSKSLPIYAMELAAELFAGKTLDQFDGNTWMQRGKDGEAEAADWYAFTTDSNVQAVGFITNDAGTVGCSPDRLVNDDGLLEIKYPKAQTLLEIIAYVEKNGLAPPDYRQQPQAQMYVTGRAYADTMFYHPDVMPPLIVRAGPDRAQFAAFDTGLAALFAERDAHLATLKRRAGR